ncbi:MAG: hypothetical protein NVSMB6_23480 [Burkholderiaceae bacterium]
MEALQNFACSDAVEMLLVALFAEWNVRYSLASVIPEVPAVPIPFDTDIIVPLASRNNFRRYHASIRNAFR